jgi:hypothetical protein
MEKRLDRLVAMRNKISTRVGVQYRTKKGMKDLGEGKKEFFGTLNTINYENNGLLKPSFPQRGVYDTP